VAGRLPNSGSSRFRAERLQTIVELEAPLMCGSFCSLLGICKTHQNMLKCACSGLSTEVVWTKGQSGIPRLARLAETPGSGSQDRRTGV
jgi:hypothetical protein